MSTLSSRKKPRLSVVYATYNEEANLARSLDSVVELADELIVVDGSSPDDTVKIAKQYKAQVISTTNKPIFHINKQMAMDAATGDWVLQMDADEELDAEMQQAVQRIKDSEDDVSLPAAYWLRRKNWFLGHFFTKGGQYPDPVIRLYQRGKAFLPMKTVHEQMEVDGEVGWLDGHLLHYNSPDFSVYLRKSNTYTTLSAQEMDEQGVPLSFLSAVQYMVWKPFVTFVMLYGRHKGFQDGFPGLVFAWFSGVHHAIAYIKYWERKQTPQS